MTNLSNQHSNIVKKRSLSKNRPVVDISVQSSGRSLKFYYLSISTMAPVRKYKNEQMRDALDAFRNSMGVREACRSYKIPKNTLLDKLRGRTV